QERNAKHYVGPSFSIQGPEVNRLRLSNTALDQLRTLERLSIANGSPRERVEDYLLAVKGLGNFNSTRADDKKDAAQLVEAMTEVKTNILELQRHLSELQLDVHKIRVILERTA